MTQPINVRIVEDVGIGRLTQKEFPPLVAPLASWFLEFQRSTAFYVETILEEVATYALWIVEIALFGIKDSLLCFQCIAAIIEGGHKVWNFDVGEMQPEQVDAGVF